TAIRARIRPARDRAPVVAAAELPIRHSSKIPDTKAAHSPEWAFFFCVGSAIKEGIVSLPSPKPAWRYLLLPACLSPGLNRLCAGFWTTRLGAGISNQVPLPVQAGNEHGPAVVIAAWLVGRDIRWFSPFWCDISQALAEAAARKR